MHSLRVIVIGGGVMGLSTAYHLAKTKSAAVVVLEKGPVGDGSSSRAAGIITGHLWTETGIRVRRKCLELYRQLSQELPGYHFNDVGCLNLFDGPTWAERENLLPLYAQLEVPFEVLKPEEIRRRWPALGIRDDFIGLFDPLGGYSAPEEYIPALARKVRELGVEIREHVKVTDFTSRNGRVSGVRTAAGDLEADAVVCTVHAWTNILSERVGLRLPVKFFVHQRYVTGAFAQPVAIPVINANPLNGYVRPAAGRRVLVGFETAEREEFRVPSPDFHQSALAAAPELRQQVIQNFVQLVPQLAQTSVESERVGLLAFSLDGEPVLGPVAKLPGFYVAFAFHSGGFAYNPAAGLLMAENVAEGKTSIDITTFSPDRFTPKQTDDYLSAMIKQKEVSRRRH